MMVLKGIICDFVLRGLGVAGAALLVGAMAGLSGAVDEAKAQYRAGDFVNGVPVFARRRPARRLMRLRGRRSGTRRSRARYRSSRRAARRVGPTPGEVDVRSSQLPPLPVRQLGRVERVQGVTSSRNEGRLRGTRKRVVKRTPVMQIVVSLDRQRLTVYEDGRVIHRSAVSSGKAGHRTPTGVFSIIQKRRHHRSNIYSGAPMPYMQRMTWSGIALHEGPLPGYAASHGCVRLPRGFARKLFKATRLRTHVVVASGNPVPRLFSHANLPGASDLNDVKLAVLDAPPTAPPDRPQRLAGWPLQSLWTPVNYALGGTHHAAPPEYDREVYALAAMLHVDQSDMLAHRHRVTRTRSEAPLRVLVTRRTQRDQIRDVQRQFVALGYGIGELDGRLGRRMIAVIKAFQRARKLRLTGQPDAATRDALDAVTGMPRPSAGTVYVRQNGRQIYAGPVAFERPAEPIGTHLYTLVELADDAGQGTWTAMTVQRKGRLPSWSQRSWRQRLEQVAAVTAPEAIARIRFPAHVRAVIEDRLTPGSSLIIADRGSERETGIATDFVVLTDR